nr:hypothetical protein [Tanacetum cinerariifolium]
MDTCTAISRIVEHLELDKIAQALEITKLKRRVKKLERRNKVKVLKLRRLQKVGTTQKVETSDNTMMDDVSNQGRMIAEMDQDADVVLEEAKEEDESEPAEVQEVVDVVTTAKIIIEVVTTACKTITTASTTITTAEAQVPAAPARVTVVSSRRTKGVVIWDPEESTTTTTTTSIIIPAETKSKDKGKEILPDMIAEEISDKLNEDKCFDPGRGINVSTRIEDDDYFPFMFVIRFFLPYFIFPEISPLLLSDESEDTIFDPGISD